MPVLGASILALCLGAVRYPVKHINMKHLQRVLSRAAMPSVLKAKATELTANLAAPGSLGLVRAHGLRLDVDLGGMHGFLSSVQFTAAAPNDAVDRRIARQGGLLRCGLAHAFWPMLTISPLTLIAMIVQMVSRSDHVREPSLARRVCF
jgi:hypothetical protein